MADAQRVTCAQDQLATVTLPAEVDVAGSRRLCGELGSALASAAVVIVDMTATTYCHSSGVHILLLAQEQAAATGVDLRLVVPSAAVLRTLASTGADLMLPIYPSLEEALAAEASGQNGHRTRPATSRAGSGHDGANAGNRPAPA